MSATKHPSFRRYSRCSCTCILGSEVSDSACWTRYSSSRALPYCKFFTLLGIIASVLQLCVFEAQKAARAWSAPRSSFGSSSREFIRR